MNDVRFRVTACLAAAIAAITPGALAQDATASPAPAVHIIWMGGSDCPPCVAWRQFELPKLQRSPEFAAVRFSYVVKTIGSSVPASFFLPAEVKPYKDQLDEASAGRHGSPQAAILVNGKVYDYFHGVRSAEDFERMLVAIRTGNEYPFTRCLKVSRQWGKCEVEG
jgi:hypothetical protein